MYHRVYQQFESSKTQLPDIPRKKASILIKLKERVWTYVYVHVRDDDQCP